MNEALEHPRTFYAQQFDTPLKEIFCQIIILRSRSIKRAMKECKKNCQNGNNLPTYHMLPMYAAPNIHLFSNQMIDGGCIGSVPSPRKDNRSARSAAIAAIVIQNSLLQLGQKNPCHKLKAYKELQKTVFLRTQTRIQFSQHIMRQFVSSENS